MARIAIVTNSLSGGGAERAMNILANELLLLGNQVILIPLNESLPDSVQLKCDVVEIGRKWRGSFFNTFFSWRKFNRAISHITPDLMILNCDLPEFFGALSISRTKIVVVEHVNYPWRTRIVLGKIIRNILERKNVTWVVVSDHLKIWPSAKNPDEIIYNPLLKIDTIPHQSSMAIERLVFLGRFTYQKNANIFLEIAAQSKLPTLLIGDGEEKKALQEYAVKLNIDSEFVGWKSKPWNLILDGDLLIVPSRFEGDGLVVVEAIQRRVPIMISDIPEFRRFCLSDCNYASDINSYVSKIQSNRTNLLKFQVDDNTSAKLIESRDPKIIANKWQDLINAQVGLQDK